MHENHCQHEAAPNQRQPDVLAVTGDSKADVGHSSVIDDAANLRHVTPLDEKPGPQVESQNDESIHWSSFASELGLRGLAQEIVLNSTLESLQPDYLCLNISNELLEFVNPTIEDEISRALEMKLGVSLRLELMPRDEMEVETPKQFNQRSRQEQKKATIEAIRQDDIFKKLQQAFGAELVESSVRKIKL